MAELVVQFAPAAAAAMRSGAREPAAERIRAALRVAGIALQPLDPESDDGPLAAYFGAQPEDVGLAERVAAALRILDGVAAAYVKPTTALP